MQDFNVIMQVSHSRHRSKNLLHINNHQNNPLNSTFLSLWPTNIIRETNDDYESFERIQQEEERQQTIDKYQQQGETNLSHNKINHLGTRQMADNINSSSEQRQFSAGGNGGNGSNNNSIVHRKKANNNSGNGGDLTASPKYNKLNTRGYNREIQQQQKHNRGQRNVNSGNAKYRTQGQQNNANSEQGDYFDYVDVDGDDDGSNEIFGLDESLIGKQNGGSSAKKTNMSHLLNFHYRDKQRSNIRGNRRSSNSNYYSNNNKWSANGNSTYRQSFSKEQFLQANCQFVVQSGVADYSLHFADPDLAIDWSHVEQVRLHSMQPLKCPICLSEPQAGKITRCGHVYCWSCLLHYLALSDKPWRKCPVCAESIYKDDIRSVRGIVSRSLKAGDWITFRLMCRERGSVLFYPRNHFQSLVYQQHEPEGLVVDANKQQHTHLLSANDETILNEIIEKEKLELLKQLEEDGEQPEACFIKQALEENNKRELLIQDRVHSKKAHGEIKIVPTQPKIEEKFQPTKPTLVYDDAFDDVVASGSTEKEAIHDEETSDLNLPVPSDANTSQPTSNVQSHLHFFYQADGIFHAYLNGFNTRMLLHEYGCYQQCPDELHVRVEAIESYFMTEDVRSHFRSLSHLPLTCEFQVIEIRLHPPLISPMTMQTFAEEFHRRRQLRTRKERLEKRRQQQAEYVESQKLFSQYPPEMMYIPQESFPVNGTNSMEEFPAMISNTTASSSPPSASVQLSDENLSPPAGVSFAQMLKQQAPPSAPKPMPTAHSISIKSSTIEISSKNKKSKKKNNGDSDNDEPLNEDEEYYASVPNFHSSFSLEGVFDRLKLVNGEEHPATAIGEVQTNVTSKKKNKKTKQVLFATGLGGQAKL
ncbi:unnamed protein product [Adineta ricciae]|uniref:E3 ubiquitin-protein ligase RNF10 n=1 Tax=Adineta ricciae TaxID=249248 RepID=A0A814AHW1_ADIRI|nr:unnamed protein product [Adineta ricciae]